MELPKSSALEKFYDELSMSVGAAFQIYDLKTAQHYDYAGSILSRVIL